MLVGDITAYNVQNSIPEKDYEGSTTLQLLKFYLDGICVSSEEEDRKISQNIGEVGILSSIGTKGY